MPKVRRVNPNIKAGLGRTKRDIEVQADKMNHKSGQGSEEKTGSIGTLRIIIDGERPYLEIKSKQGWVRSDNTSVSGFSFKK